MPSKRIRTLAALFLGGMLVIHAATWWRLRELVTGGYPDFTSFYSAGQIVRKGMGQNLYDETTESRVQREVASSVSRRVAALPYVHAPFEALFFVPLSLLSYNRAYLLWNLVNLTILFSLPFLLKRHFALLQAGSPVLWTLALLGFFPVFFTMLQGQDSILLLLVYSLVFVALKRGSWFSAGCWLALGLFRFHLVVPLLLVMLLLRKWKLLAGFLLSSLGLAALSAAAVGWLAVIRYPIYIWSLEQREGRVILPPRDNPNLRGLIGDIFSRWPDRSVLLMVIAISALAIFLLMKKSFRIRENESQVFDLWFSLALLVVLLVSYHVFLYDFSLLVIAVLAVLNYFFIQEPGRRSARIGLLAPMALLFCTPVYFVVWLHWQQANLLALVLLLWVWALSREISASPVEAIPDRA